jgi:hypothetical protein
MHSSLILACLAFLDLSRQTLSMDSTSVKLVDQVNDGTVKYVTRDSKQLP